MAILPWDGGAPPPETATHARILDNAHWRLFVLGDSLDLLPLLREVGRIGAIRPLEVDGPSGKIMIAIERPR